MGKPIQQLWLTRETFYYHLYDREPKRHRGTTAFFSGEGSIMRLCTEELTRLFPAPLVLPRMGEFVKLNVEIDGTYYTYMAKS